MLPDLSIKEKVAFGALEGDFVEKIRSSGNLLFCLHYTQKQKLIERGPKGRGMQSCQKISPLYNPDTFGYLQSSL